MDQSPFSEANNSSASQKFPAFSTTRKFVAYTRAHHISTSQARGFQSTPPSYFLKTHFNIILSSTPTSFKLALFPGFPMQTLRAHHLSPKLVTLISGTIPKTVWRDGEIHEESHSRQSAYGARSEPVTFEIKVRRFTVTPCLLGNKYA